MNRRLVAVLGGSFDPVHKGHVALAGHCVSYLQADELRLIPAGNPWQKPPLDASGENRIAMLNLAFAGFPVPWAIDHQEVDRSGPTYTIDTARSLRAELDEETAIVLLMGADQLQRLDTWKEWPRLFDHLHLCVASRPGFSLSGENLPAEVAQALKQRIAQPHQLHTAAAGLLTVTETLDLDVAASDIRKALASGADKDCEPLNTWLAPAVLDYIHQHHLYGR